MRAARLYGKDDLRVEEIPVPGIGPGEVLLRVKAAAVCGTDIRMFRNGARAATPENPLVLGHEVSGVVEAVGDGVTRLPARGWRWPSRPTWAAASATCA